jgi:hypothetical protein
MAISAWSEAIPSGTSQVGQFPTYGRSTFGNISTGMAVEHFWNGSGGGSELSAGDLRPGGSRAFFDVQSNSSAPGSQQTGRLFLASDTTRLFVYDSTGTYLVGTPFCGLHQQSALTKFWLRQTGSYSIATSGGTSVNGSFTTTFPIPYVTAPQIYTSPSEAVLITAVATSNTTNFTSSWSQLALPSDTTDTIFWEALGLASSGSF